MSLGEYISGRRKRMRLTQEELACKINVSKSAIAKWETNGGIPDRDNLRKLAEVLGISVDDLHRIIDSGNAEEIDLKVNITSDVIASLESYGYIVIRPGENKDMDINTSANAMDIKENSSKIQKKSEDE